MHRPASIVCSLETTYQKTPRIVSGHKIVQNVYLVALGHSEPSQKIRLVLFKALLNKPCFVPVYS